MLVLLILYGAHCFVGVYGLKKLVKDDITVAFASYETYLPLLLRFMSVSRLKV